jgi:bacillithiol biosynthesis cysteine-adding enzyme BshC
VTLLEAYRSGALRDFHRLEPNDFAAAFDTPHPADRTALGAAVLEYLRAVNAPKAVLENAKRLAHPESKVVMTGQQAGLLLGPVYTVSKAVTAILLARQHNTDERPVVPMFWVASQDHDADEVRGAALLDLNETLHSIALELPPGVAMGKVALQPAWLEEVRALLESFNAPAEFKQPVVESVTRCFETSGTYAEWFARLLLELLGAHGLVVVDPMHASIAPLFVPHLNRELERFDASSKAIEDAAQRLEAQGFKAQLRRTPNSSNLFLENARLERQLLKVSGQMYTVDGVSYTCPQLKGILAADATRLTPAAGLRPIIADATFPVAVNVLGPGELAYHLELGGVYALHGVAQPLMHQRMSVTVLEPPVTRILQKYDLSAAEFLKQGRAALEARALERSSAAAALQEGLRDLEAGFNKLRANLEPFEPGLGKALTRGEGSIRFNLARLERKLGAAILKADDTAEQQVDRLERHLLPRGTPQERLNSFLEFQMKFGTLALERMLKLEPTGTHFLEI